MLKLRKSLVAFIFCSIFIHLLAWSGLELFPKRQNLKTRPKAVEVVILDSTEKKSPQDQKDKISQQVVDQSKKALNDEEPDKARFLSRHNQKVERETRAKNFGVFSNAAQQGAKSSGASVTSRNNSKKSTFHKKFEHGHLPSLAALKPDFNLGPPAPPNGQEGSAGNPSQTDDHLKDTPIGIQTLLSTKEFVYFSYYNRIKEKIRQYWEPNIRENVKMAVRRGRSIASVRDRVTKVLITLDKNGTLIQVQVLGESGIVELDSAAVDAFKSAAPFPNPPQGMIESDGNIRIRWDFILEASSFNPTPNQEDQNGSQGDKVV